MGTDFLEIPGYRPVWRRGAPEITAHWGELVAGFAGRRLEQIWLLYSPDGDWFSDAPVVIQLDDTLLEICHHKLKELSVTVDTINLDQPVEWPWEGWSWGWRACDLEGTSTLIRQRINSVDLVEWCGGRDDIANGTVAVRIDVDDETLLVFNGLDENAVAVGRPDERYRSIVG